jgi:hypothetical protein
MKRAGIMLGEFRLTTIEWNRCQCLAFLKPKERDTSLTLESSEALFRDVCDSEEWDQEDKS